jgi:cell division transport system permease protein
MFWTNLKRIARSGWVSFWRNGYVTLASILVMTVTLSVIAAILFTGALLKSTLAGLQQKVDITVYFVTSAPEGQIITIQKRLQTLPEVASVTYTSRAQALADFKNRHANESDIMQSLNLLDDNPLQASLNIKAKDPTQYEGLAQYLNSDQAMASDGTTIVDKITYAQNKNAIDTLNRIIAASHKLGLVLTLFFGLISILITFNTIRLAIHFSREEISVMRLVGASTMHIRGPFVIEGLLYGLVSGVVTLVLLYPVLFWLGPISQNLGTGINLLSYYIENFGKVFLLIIGSGLVIGAISSYLAVKRYLKV